MNPNTPIAIARLTRDPIDALALTSETSAATVGAIATFLGIVRAENNSTGAPLEALDYTAHESMALAEMQRIADAVAAANSFLAIRLVHRLGTLRVGEASIVVVVASPHRPEAFEACREVVERVKVDVPIFKREIWRGGRDSWVNPVSLGENA